MIAKLFTDLIRHTFSHEPISRKLATNNRKHSSQSILRLMIDNGKSP